MTKEEYNKHKKLIEEWGNGAKIQYYNKTKEEWVNIENPLWDYYSEYRIKPTKIDFEDCHFNEIEYKVDKIGKVVEVRVDRLKINNSRTKSTLFKDKEIAEAYSVLPKLIRLRDKYNENWYPDWGDDNTAKYYIGRYGNDWDIDFTYKYPYLLCFKSFAIRNKFLEDHRDLIEIAKPLL